MQAENSRPRITGNALIHIVDIIAAQNKKRDIELTQSLIEHASITVPPS